jgi:RNA polymerase sigma factor (sigma-70 family)
MNLHSKNTSAHPINLEKLRNGNRKAQHELYHMFAPKMFALCMRYTSSRQEAEDLMQEAFIKVFRHLHQFTGLGNFEGWVRRIFVNTALEFLRKRSSWSDLEASDLKHLPSENRSVYEEIGLQDTLKLIQSLSDGYRTIFNLYAIEGYSHREIAKMLNISEGTSKSQLSRAKAILQKSLILAEKIA